MTIGLQQYLRIKLFLSLYINAGRRMLLCIATLNVEFDKQHLKLRSIYMHALSEGVYDYKLI